MVGANGRATSSVMHVMAGVLMDEGGQVLMAQRPQGKHLAGMWEFPGGKLEPGETPQAALARELREELGIRLESAQPLIRVPWRYGERRLCLDAWCIHRWQGTPRSLEGQGLQWALPAIIDPAILAPADRPILQALRLPASYAITPADVTMEQGDLWFRRIGEAIEQGVRLLQLRLPLWTPGSVRELAAALMPLARKHDAWLVLNGDIEGAATLQLGVHLTAAQLKTVSSRPLPAQQLVGASCHDATQLAEAVACGADFATLSPVAATASHPDQPPLGWFRFRSLAEAAALPVYALGGMSSSDIQRAREACAQGIAGIRGFWPV